MRKFFSEDIPDCVLDDWGMEFLHGLLRGNDGGNVGVRG